MLSEQLFKAIHNEFEQAVLINSLKNLGFNTENILNLLWVKESDIEDAEVFYNDLKNEGNLLSKFLKLLRDRYLGLLPGEVYSNTLFCGAYYKNCYEIDLGELEIGYYILDGDFEIKKTYLKKYLEEISNLNKPKINCTEKLQYIILTNSIIVVREGVPITIDKSHKSYTKICDILNTLDDKLINSKIEEIYRLMDMKVALEDYSNGLVTIKNGKVTYNGEELDGRIVYILLNEFEAGNKEGLDKLSNFLNNVQLSESWKIRNKLFEFLENNQFEITQEGYIVSYKVVNPIYLDKHTETFDNSPGSICKIDRKEVDDRDEVECSYGLHICGKYYIPHFYRDGDKVMKVIVKPQNFVTSPPDYFGSKARVTEYLVESDITKECKEKGLI